MSAVHTLSNYEVALPVPLEEVILEESAEVGVDLEPHELKAIGGMLLGKRWEDEAEGMTRFNIVQAKYRATMRQRVNERDLALNAVLRSVQDRRVVDEE